MPGRKQTATLELAIGATMLASVIVLIAMLLAWGNNSALLSKHYRVVVVMTNVGGLRQGAPVKMGGFQIGRVSQIQPRPGATDLEIVLDIDEKRLLPKDSTAKVSTAGLVGDAFMEIIPGTSADTITRADTVADADRLASSPVPDFSELQIQLSKIGDQVTLMAGYINDILGDDQFRRNIKSIAVNLDSTSYEANMVLQRGQRIVDNIEQATLNISALSETLKADVEKTSQNILQLTNSAKEIAVSAERTINNIDGGVTEARKAIGMSLGNEEFNANLRKTIKNVANISDGLAAKRPQIEATLANLQTISEKAIAIGDDVKAVTAKIDPEQVKATFDTLLSALSSVNTAVEDVKGVVDKIKNDPVLALSVNKASDRIIKMKFDEMSKDPRYKTADETLREISRWVNESMQRGHFNDPYYNQNNRPYRMGQ